MKKRILLLGATGSIGLQTLDIIRKYPEYFELTGIAGGTREKELLEIGKEFGIPKRNIFIGKRGIPEKRSHEYSLQKYTDTSSFKSSIQHFISQFDNIDIFVNAISGMAGIPATREIIKQSKPLCLANKESLVAEGEWIMKTKKCPLIPLDSEHSSMKHLMSKVSKSSIKKIWLTCSGGPFRDAQVFPKESFSSLTKHEALQHPTWSMGSKISIDSATLMNKAFELIEAVRLFTMPYTMFEIVIHPQSIIHAGIETNDGNILMEGSHPTMSLPLARGLFEASSRPLPPCFSIPSFSPFGKQLSFEPVDESRFPSIGLAKTALTHGDDMCRKLLEHNEYAVKQFLDEEISFADIFPFLQKGVQ